MLFAFFFLPLAVASLEPEQAVWSSQAFGADGPWNAVEVSIGSQPKISLFPGRMWHTFVTTSDYCAFNNSVPHCQSGTYLKDKVVAGSTASSSTKISYKPPSQQLNAGIAVTGESNMYLDSIDMQIGGGVIQNTSLALIESQMLVYPGGALYPIFTGCLNIGAPEPQQIFTGSNSVNASMIPWALKSKGFTASSSFGLHYGSAGPSAKMSGSLLFGGYDRNRVVGDVISFEGDFWKSVTLQDISMRVVKGSSPFDSFPADNIKKGLLAAGNSSITSAGLSVLLDPCSPYITLPKSTCDSIASHLPVSYNESLGLYIWDTSSPRYSRIVSSASALSFTFMGQSNTDTLTIHVPFRHLNLTLSPPFVDEPTPYLPCFTGGIGAYVLGRAFFQDAFLGANWEKNKIWLAQAPGPNVPARVDAATVQPDDETITGGANDWERSWEGFWTELSAEETNGTAPVEGSTSGGGEEGGGTSSVSTAGGGGGGLSTSAMVGIAVGAAVVVMALIGVAGFFFWRRWKAGRVVPQARPGTLVEPVYGDRYGEKPPAWAGVLVEAPAPRVLVEAPVPDHRVYEMPAGDYWSRAR